MDSPPATERPRAATDRPSCFRCVQRQRRHWRRWRAACGNTGTVGSVKRRLLRRTAAVLCVVAAFAVGAGAGTWWWLENEFDDIPTFDELAHPTRTTGDGPASTAPVTALTLPEPTAEGISTFLVFGVGSQGVDDAEGARTGIGDDRLSHSDGLTDTIALVVADASTGRVAVVSIPRDTWLEHRRTRINAVYVADGPQAFADEVTSLTGIPVHHMVAVNFAGAVDVVDTFGGVALEVPVPLRDRNSGLSLEAGCVRLDGAQALALMRSRHLQYIDGGRWRTDPTGDFGRIERTQQLLAAMADQVSLPALPTQVPALLDAAADNLVRDAGLGLGDVVSLARAFSSGVEVRFWQPPASPTRRGAASVVVWQPDAEVVLARLAAAVEAGTLAGTEFDDPVPVTDPGVPPTSIPDLVPASTTTASAPAPSGVSKVPPLVSCG